MQKIPTLFIRNPENMKLVTREVNPDATWVLEGHGIPTRKMDGTNIRVTIQNECCIKVEKRRNPSREEKAQGAEPGYIDAHREDPADKYIFASVDATPFADWPDGAWHCEALGPKIQGGAEVLTPMLYPFTLRPYPLTADPRTHDEIHDFLTQNEIEGIVWHHPDGKMAKIKRRDFGLLWPVK
jgi:Family of unknown function (DUF5565)